jgi:flavin-dependent dehydrogenase
MADLKQPGPDVIVVGGGPAGSTTATLLAQGGRRVVLFDRERFPRFRIGESLMPATYWTFRRLGVLDKLLASPFPRKHSVQFFSKSGRSSVPFYFTEFDPHDSSVTWQVDRATFDRMLLDHSRESGVDVHEGANVRDVLFEGERARGVLVELADGSRAEVLARVVVDATGQTAMLSRRFGLKDPDPELLNAAFFTRFDGAWRGPGIDEGATLVLNTAQARCWFWYIPLPRPLTSVGVVGPMNDLVRDRPGRTPQEVFDELRAQCPALDERLRGARQTGPVTVLRDFSYISRRIAGDGWVMVGDAFGFLDPIYSTGVLLGLTSAEMAAESILDAFAANDFSAARLGRHGPRYVAGMEAMRKLVYAYYDESFHVRQLIDRFPECKRHITNLLMGNVFRRPHEGFFEALGQMMTLPEARTLEADPAAR